MTLLWKWWRLLWSGFLRPLSLELSLWIRFLPVSYPSLAPTICGVLNIGTPPLFTGSAIRTRLVPWNSVESQGQAIRRTAERDGDCTLSIREGSDGEFVTVR